MVGVLSSGVRIEVGVRDCRIVYTMVVFLLLAVVFLVNHL